MAGVTTRAPYKRYNVRCSYFGNS